MQENQVLRQLLKSLSGFIGDGAGGLLPKLGWDLNDFNNFVNRSETDTAWESYQRHKREAQANKATSAPSTSTSNKRSSDTDDTAARSKRPRSTGEQDGADNYPIIVPVNTATLPNMPPGNIYPPPATRSHESTLFNDLMRGASGSPMFPSAGASTTNGQYGAPSSGNSAYSTSYMPPMSVNVDSGLQGMPMVNSSVQMSSSRVPSSSQPPPKPMTPVDDEQDPKRHEAFKLIQ
jgi:hypothetical protein